jgi:hypothetical protein
MTNTRFHAIFSRSSQGGSIVAGRDGMGQAKHAAQRNVIARHKALRMALVASAMWAGCICGIALYERNAVDPWKFIGEDRGAMFFTWSRQLVYGASPFGEIRLVLDAPRFWTTLLAPIVIVLAGACIAPAFARGIHRILRDH